MTEVTAGGVVIGDEEKSELKSLLVLTTSVFFDVVAAETFVGFFFLRFFACCSGDALLSLDLDEERLIGDVGLMQTNSLEDDIVRSIVP